MTARAEVVNLTETSVDLRREGSSAFMVPNLATASRKPDGVLAWDPGASGVLGGMVRQETRGDHNGERHLDGDELIVAVSGQLTIVLLEDDGTERQRLPLQENEATLVPRGVWHRLEIESACRYLFFGGGRTEIRMPRRK